MSDIKIDEKPVSNSESGILAALWRKLIKDNHLTNAIPMLVNRYVSEHDPTHGRVKNIKRRNRSTIISNICSGEMTFKTFVDLVFNLLKAVKVEFHISVTLTNGRSVQSKVVITSDSISQSAEQDDYDKIYEEVERSKNERPSGANKESDRAND